MIGRKLEQKTVAKMQNEGATAEEAIRYVLQCRRRHRGLRRIALAAGICPNTVSRIVNNEGGITYYNAEMLVHALGYRLTLEVLDEKADSYIPDDDSHRMHD